MDMYTFINEIVMGCLEGIVFFVSYLVVINKREFIEKDKIRFFLFITTYTVFGFYVSTILPNGIHTFVLLAFVIITLSVFTSSRMILSIIGTAIIMIYLFVTEFAIVLVFTNLAKATMEQILNDPVVKLQFSVIAKVIQLSFVFLTFKFQIPSLAQFFKNTEERSISFFVLGLFMMGIFDVSVVYLIDSPENIFLFEILLHLIFLLFIILGFWEYREKEKLLRIQNHYQIQKKHIGDLEAIIKIIRKEKHEYSNQLATIYALCTLNKENAIEKITEYIQRISKDLKTGYRFFDTGNDFLDGLLAVKSSEANQYGINLEVELGVPIHSFSIDDIDLISVVGNIVDNAFRSVKEKEGLENPIVSLYTYEENNYYCLSILNNGFMIPKELQGKIFDNGFSTKKDKTQDHGFGLYIVKQIIEKNNGKITVISTEEETEFLIEFEKGECYDGEINYSYN